MERASRHSLIYVFASAHFEFFFLRLYPLDCLSLYIAFGESNLFSSPFCAYMHILVIILHETKYLNISCPAKEKIYPALVATTWLAARICAKRQQVNPLYTIGEWNFRIHFLRVRTTRWTCDDPEMGDGGFDGRAGKYFASFILVVFLFFFFSSWRKREGETYIRAVLSFHIKNKWKLFSFWERIEIPFFAPV